MAEPEERYIVHEPRTGDTDKDVRELVRQINEQFRRIAEKIADKADA